jgi:peroxiredoxin family protein
MSRPDPNVLREMIFEIIENQIRDGVPPETKETFDRLIAEGYSKEETLKLMGCAVSSEIFGVLKEGRKYDEAAYIEALKSLPKLPWESQSGGST